MECSLTNPVSHQDDEYSETQLKYSKFWEGKKFVIKSLCIVWLIQEKMGYHHVYKHSTTFAGFLPCFYKPFLPMKPISLWGCRYKIILSQK